MFRTGIVAYGVRNWIFLWLSLHLFTYVQGGEEDPGVRFTTEPSDAVVLPGEDALLLCAAASKLPVRLAWRYSASSLPTRDHGVSISDKSRKQLLNGSLLIESMTASLAGQYQCVATVDGIGTIVSRAATVFLAEVPVLSGTPRSVLSAVGGVALLPCGIQAPPRLALRVVPAANTDRRAYGAAKLLNTPPLLKLNVTWLKNGSPVRTESARVSITPSGALEIEPLRHHDAASYRCRVSITPHLYRVSDEIELRVSADTPNTEAAPRFVAMPQSLTVMEGGSATLDCAAIGNPKPEIIWLNNGVAIDLSDLDSRLYLVGSGSLRLRAARAGDAGAYTCRAHSRLDSSDHTAHLHVLTPPRVWLPSGAVGAARARGDVTLRCDVRGRPAPAVAWLKDGDLLTPNNHDIALLDGSSLRIQGVLNVDSGMFQCFATSSAGSATGSLRLVVLPPDDEFTPKRSQAPLTTSISSRYDNTNSTQDIFNSLVSSDPSQDFDSNFPEDVDDPDFLGETSSAYTLTPELKLYGTPDPDLIENSLHAAKGMDLDLLKKGNASIVSPPRALRAVIVKHRFVTLSWDEPERNSGDVVGYAVMYRVKGSERERISRGGAQKHEMNIASLQPNTTYQFAVVAYTAGGASPPTQIIEVHTPEEELTFGPPLSVTAEATGPHSVRVAWSPPVALSPPDNYTLLYTEVDTGREQYQLVEAPQSQRITATISGLRAATQYSIQVSAAGGEAAPGVTVHTRADAPSAPPGNVTAVSTGSTSIVVRWDAPPSRSHRGPLTGYKVRYRPLPAALPGGGGSRRKADSLTTPADTRRAELRDLDPSTTYQIRVCAINANGSGPFSEWVSAGTGAAARDDLAVPAQPPPLTTRAGRDWISVWWEGGGAVGGYVLGWGVGVPDVRTRDLPPHLHSYVIRELEPNSEYVISLRASNSLGLGPPVYATVRTRPPSPDYGGLEGAFDEGDEDEEDDEEPAESSPLIPPVGLKVIMLSGTTAVVYWTDPTLPKGQAATDGRQYVVRWGSAGGGRPRTYNASDLNCMLDDLRPYTTYEFAVKLIKGGRESAWSMLVSNTTLEAPPGSPPRDPRAAPASPPARAADVSWSPPAKPNGIITGYVIMYAAQSAVSGGGAEWIAVGVTGDRARVRLDRLRPRTTYSIKLQARNSKGLGPFSQTITYTTAMETGEGGGLASATSAWLWASAGGACAVLALAAALALSLCCRRSQPPLSPDTSTYQKSSASAGIKPPDLWIHHDQMELKHMDKGIHASASKISSDSVEGSLSLPRSAPRPPAPPPVEYEPARGLPPPSSLDRRHYVPTYVESGAASCTSGSEAASVSSCRRCDLCELCQPMTGVGAGCTATCDRRQHRPLPDQSTPLVSGVGPLLSAQSSLASLQPPPAPCGSGTCPLGSACTVVGGVGGGPAPGGGDIYASAARERGHYVAYEPLGHYTHSEAPGGGSLRRGAGGSVAGPVGGPGGVVGSIGGPGGLHSFALDATSEHSTPAHSHSRGSVRETSPYKKSAGSSPGHIPNRLQLGGNVSHCPEELEPLTPSRSTERLNREMQNLEGLMKDLSAITQHQFHC
ncbi:neogenin isoform X2 [Bombyx mori]|uniref:Hemolin n=1 Tax=Bombyx mori TaxID=7091 RepID=A0A8R2M024_BOMMO|nr:neogenin isoform X2 [Bombyx mori]